MTREHRILSRIMDANLNRSREGLRVCEEITRFALNSKTLTKRLKDVRHEISKMKDKLKGTDTFFGTKKVSVPLSLSRDVKGDVGKALWPKSELEREDFKDIFEANIERVKESLRVLEEFSKMIDNASSKKFSALRFKVYEIEKSALTKVPSLRNT